jgi:hypothetical protein
MRVNATHRADLLDERERAVIDRGQPLLGRGRERAHRGGDPLDLRDDALRKPASGLSSVASTPR